MWQRQIIILKEKIKELEKNINEAETSQAAGFKTTEKVLNDEALVGVVHLERVDTLDDELVELDTYISLTNARLALS